MADKKNLAARICTCTLGIPALALLIFLLPQYNFIGLSLFTVLLAFSGSAEMEAMVFGKKNYLFILSGMLPLIQYLQLLFNINIDITNIYLVLTILVLFCREIGISGSGNDFKLSIERNAKSLLVIIYPSYFLMFLVRMFALESTNSYSIMLFLLLVFTNDIFAYVFGMLFGKAPSRGYVVKASPHKSIQGFVGGHVCSVLTCLIWFAIFKDYLVECSWTYKVGMGLLVSLAANMGDLLESVFKRSACVKDSGHIVPGRGGILDSTDSIMSAAPVFFILYSIIG